MSDHRTPQSNTSGQDNVFDLESILAEFSSSGQKAAREKAPEAPPPPAPPSEEEEETLPIWTPRNSQSQQDLPWPEPPRPDMAQGNVVRFPGKGTNAPPRKEDSDNGPSQQEETVSPAAAPQEPELPEEETGEEEKVLHFPEEQSLLSSLFSRLNRKADAYAGHMFEDAGSEISEETRRIESLIPGVDEEETPAQPPRRRRQEPLPPDVPPRELARRYSAGQKFLHLRSRLIFLLSLLLAWLTVSVSLGLPLPAPLASSYVLQIYLSACLLGVCMILAGDCILRSFLSVFQLKFGMDTLVSLACIATLADSCTMLYLTSRQGTLPLCVVGAFSLYFLTHGVYLRRSGQRLACKVAAAAEAPFLVTLDEEKWNSRDTYCKYSASTAGFGSQIRADDGAQRIYYRAAPVLLVCAVLFSLLSSLGQKKPELFLWCLSATLTACASFSATLIYGRTFARLARRLNTSGAAIAGWPGVSRQKKQAYILLTDSDLFPPGSVRLNGIKIFGAFSPERVIACTATILRDAGSGLSRVFYELLRAHGAIYRTANLLRFYEGGGYSANIHGDQVLVGSAAFMSLMEIPITQGLHVKNAVFCAINGELAGLFALNYTLPDTVSPAISALLQEKLEPVLATRDFNLIPAMLQQRFKLPTAKMQFPPVERRRALSEEEQEHSDIITAVLCREGLGPYSEAVVGGHRLCTAVKLCTALSVLGGVLGLLLTFYLTGVVSFSALCPENMLFFQLAWTIPTWLVGNWVTRF